MRFILIIAICLPLYGSAQSDSSDLSLPRGYEFGDVARSSISFNLGGVTGLAGFAYELFISPRWRVEAGFGYAAMGLAVDFYFKPIRRNSWRLRANFRDSFIFEKSGVARNSLGFGFTYFGKNRLNIGADVGPAVNYYNQFINGPEGLTKVPTAVFDLQIGVKIAYRFSWKIMKWKRSIKKLKSS